MSTDPRLQIRPAVETQPAQNPAEAFLHETLRPILKLQNELLLGITRHFLVKRKVRFATLDEAQQKQQVQHSIARDNRLRGLLFGSVVGQFTTDELTFYLDNEAEVNRRIAQLIVQRLQTQLDSLA
jgi:hypothetical protein